MTNATDTAAARRSLKVLLVEDERATAQALATLLSRRGHVVTVVGDVHEALVESGHDVVVADVSLPSGSGLEVLAKKRARGETPHAIVTTGDAGVESCRAALKLGVAEYLAKPFRPDELVRAVEGAPAAAADASNNQAAESGWRGSCAGAPEACSRLVAELVARTLARGVGAACRARIGSALSEILDNAWRHGRAARIDLAARFEGRDLVIVVSDDGVGFEPASTGLDGVAGSGLARALALAEDLRVESAPGRGARATLRFTPWNASFADDGVLDLSDADWTTPETARRVLDAIRADETVHLNPALAVVAGRLLSHDASRSARKALWS
ncbi:MAG: response regulator [Planctomycetia bacterium]|jgi:CheY-like chemotaxis protein